jgi:hypothetical protein
MSKNIGISRDEIICIIDVAENSEINNNLIEDLSDSKKIFSSKSSDINSLIITNNNGYSYLVREDTDNLKNKLNKSLYYDF